MKRKILALACSAVHCATLAACSHKIANAPLSYVPADTPVRGRQPEAAAMRTSAPC